MSILLARRFRVDATLDLTLASGFSEVKRITDFDPGITPNLEDASAYDSNGFSNKEPTMQDAVPTLTFLSQIISSVRDPGQQILFGTWTQFATAARVGVRWYDRNGLAGQDNMSGIFIPSFKRAQSGVKNLEAWTCSLELTDGTLNVGIANPGTAAVAPSIVSASPSAVAVGGLLTIIGSSFTGVTGATHVTIGGVNATSYVVEGDNMIVAIMPAGSAGSAPIIVTNAVGASAAFAYTRGA